ncbi:MAG TPA: 3-isopropylmalate dehydrogenase [Firmicutes bacterium]|jgi:3-isopropylmalate dehydrogenase|nr:3-isopropylmalate dehydrogenase [Bacillota bacterium]
MGGTYKLAVIPGDGIGPEVVDAALGVLEQIGKVYGHQFVTKTLLAGGCAIEATGNPLPPETVAACRASDAVLLGAVGGDQWDDLPGDKRPEKALLGLRGQLGLYANLRPALLYKELQEACPLKPEIIGEGLDLLVVRELTGGIYFGPKGRRTTEKMGEEAFDTEVYSEAEVERIARIAFTIARNRRRQVTSVDKANILESSRLWRAVVTRVAADYPEVKLNHLYVDNASMQLVRDPKQFDVILTTNMFGDILSDEASMITGSIGMLPSASLAHGNFGLYEPVHGSAPDLAGQDRANPIATILSVAMMLRYSFALPQEAAAIEQAVQQVLAKGYRTGDLMNPGKTLVGTAQMGKLISGYIQ